MKLKLNPLGGGGKAPQLQMAAAKYNGSEHTSIFFAHFNCVQRICIIHCTVMI